MSESAFLAVDNDPEDLAVLASALTSRYAAEYEIYTASSGTEARATLAMLSQAGRTVALLIVSREIRDQDPLFLLQQAREFFPNVRRVVSARYLDPSAFDFVTTAMRTGRTDYFLYKPCEPVVARLYPIVDDLLGRSTIPFGFYDSDSEEGRQILAKVGVDGTRLPVVCIHYGIVLVDPTNEELAVALGVKIKPDPGLYDVAIVGAGPAGLAASVYGASEGAAHGPV